jgi:ferritin-like metal-binding protein YciE
VFPKHKGAERMFAHQLRDIYYAQKQLVKALPKIAEKATDNELKQGFLTHRATDKKLTTLAEGKINLRAAS